MRPCRTLEMVPTRAEKDKSAAAVLRAPAVVQEPRPEGGSVLLEWGVPSKVYPLLVLSRIPISPCSLPELWALAPPWAW
uniref:Alternative protein TLR9 n=1 Tax=Homo sapiens TaxID=9606 RepID=L0R5D6_HUMAN|nr:alternative protein TLR9 [Homo sapiens]